MNNPTVEFYDRFYHAADDHDRDLPRNIMET